MNSTKCNFLGNPADPEWILQVRKGLFFVEPWQKGAWHFFYMDAGSQSKESRIPATKITHASERGRKTFQPNLIN